MDDDEDDNVAERGGHELMRSAKFKFRSAVSGQPRRHHRAARSCTAVGIIRGSGKWVREPFQLPTNPEGRREANGVLDTGSNAFACKPSGS